MTLPLSLSEIGSVLAIGTVLITFARWVFKNAMHDTTTAIKQNTDATSSLASEMNTANENHRRTYEETRAAFEQVHAKFGLHDTRIAVVETRLDTLEG